MSIDFTAALVFGVFMFCIIILLGIISAVLGIARSLKRTPPLDQELYRDFATKEDVRRLEAKIDKVSAAATSRDLYSEFATRTELQAMQENFSQLTSSTNNALMGLTSQISNLAGKIEAHLDQVPG